jgi:PAS domain S-box-containing protein
MKDEATAPLDHERTTVTLQDALEASEARHRIISGMISDYAYAMRIEPDGSLTHEWHAGNFSAVTGFPDAALDQINTWQQLIHPDDWPIISKRMNALFEGRAIVSEYRIITAAGETRWLRDYGQPILDDTGRLLRIHGASQDITEQKRDAARIGFQAALLNAVQQSVIATDVQGRVTFWNRQAEALYGWPAAEALGRNVLDVVVAPAQIDHAAEIMATLAKGEMWTGEFEVRRRDGSLFHTQVTDSPVFDDAGNIVGIIGISQDISNRRQRQQNERILLQVGQVLVQSISTDDRTGRLAQLLVNEFAEICTIALVNERREVFHFKARQRHPDMRGALDELTTFMPTRNPASATAQALRTGEAVFMPVVPKDFKQKTALNARHAMLREQLGFHSLITLPLIARNTVIGVVSVGRTPALPNFDQRDFDVLQEVCRSAAQYFDNARLYEQMQSMNAALEERIKQRTGELEESQSQLRQLTARVQSMREDDRRRIAREVHDVIGQLLTSLKMEAGWLTLRLDEAGNPLAERTRHMIEMLDGAFSSVRQIATDLRPTLLDDMGLIAAMEWQVEEFQRQAGVQAQFESTLDTTPISADAATAVFRILQEALTNVARHAGATRACVTVEEDHRGWLVLQVQDNGRGISPKALQQTQSLGLVGMRERVNLLGGELNIAGEPGKGTTLIIRVPMSTPQAGEPRAG